MYHALWFIVYTLATVDTDCLVAASGDADEALAEPGHSGIALDGAEHGGSRTSSKHDADVVEERHEEHEPCEVLVACEPGDVDHKHVEHDGYDGKRRSHKVADPETGRHVCAFERSAVLVIDAHLNDELNDEEDHEDDKEDLAGERDELWLPHLGQGETKILHAGSKLAGLRGRQLGSGGSDFGHHLGLERIKRVHRGLVHCV